MNKSEEEKAKKEFYRIQEKSKFHIRLYIDDCTKDNFSIKLEQKCTNSIGAQMMANFMYREEPILEVIKKAVVMVTRDMGKDDFDKKKLLDTIQDSIVDEYGPGGDVDFQEDFNGLYLEVEELISTKKKGIGSLAIRIPPSRGIFFSLLCYEMIRNEEFKAMMQRALLMAVNKSQPDTMAGKLSGLLGILKDKLDGEDDCDCPNCVERRAMEAEGKTDEEIKTHFESKEEDEDGMSGLKMEMDQEKPKEGGEANIKVAKDIINGTHDPYKDKE